MRVKEESEKVGLKLNINKTKIMAFSPIISWQTEGEKIEAVTDFLFLDSKFSADGNCSLEIRRWFLLGRKAMTKLHSVLKSKDITLLTKVHIIKPMVFPIVIYRCKSWTIEHWRIDSIMDCSISGLRRSPGEGDGYPFQYSGLENSMDCIVLGCNL